MNLPAAITDAMRRGEKIRAVKLYREATGVPLKEAVDFIDEALRRAAGKTQ
jgi:ribosomal protein L7/L12